MSWTECGVYFTLLQSMRIKGSGSVIRVRKVSCTILRVLVEPSTSRAKGKPVKSRPVANEWDLVSDSPFCAGRLVTEKRSTFGGTYSLWHLCCSRYLIREHHASQRRRRRKTPRAEYACGKLERVWRIDLHTGSSGNCGRYCTRTCGQSLQPGSHRATPA